MKRLATRFYLAMGLSSLLVTLATVAPTVFETTQEYLAPLSPAAAVKASRQS